MEHLTIEFKNNEILYGQPLNDVVSKINDIIDLVSEGYILKEVISTDITPTTSGAANIFYLATEGTYTHFGTSIDIPSGSIGIFKWNGSAWDRKVAKVCDPVSVSQNTETGGYNLTIGDKSETLASSSVQDALCQTTNVVNISKYIPANGYIGVYNNKWTDVNSSNRQHKVIPLLKNKTIHIKAGSHTAYCKIITDYNVVEGGDASVIGTYTVSANTEIEIVTPSTNAFLYYQYNSADLIYEPIWVYYGFISLTDNIVETRYIDEKAVIGGSNELAQISGRIENIGLELGFISNTDGSFYQATINYRASHRRLIHAIRDFELSCDSGHRFVIYKFQNNGTPIGYDGTWTTSKSILKGTNFRIMVRNEPENTSAEIDLNACINALTIDGTVLEELVKIKPIEQEIAEIDKPASDFPQYNGYINNGNWTDVNSSTRTHIIIPCAEDAACFIKGSASGASVIAFLSDYNVVEGGSASVLSTKTFTVNEEATLTSPTGTKYLYVLAFSATNRIPQKLDINNIDYTIGKLDSLYKIIDEGDSGNSIFSLNPHNEVITKLLNLKIGFVNYGVSTEYPPVVSLLHFSDVHSGIINLERIKQFADKYALQIDDVIQTGDLIGSQVTEGVPSNWGNVGADWLSVIGNHDATKRENDAWVTVSPEISYNTIIAPYVANWGVVQPTGAGQSDYYPCYYYKDFTTSKLRLIVLDDMQSLGGGPSHWDNTQKTWFESLLADAITNGLDVIVAKHYPPFAITHNPQNPFDSISVRPDNPYWHSSEDIPNCIKTFINNGGNFVCYISGHTHCDYFGLAQESEWNNQLVIGIASASYVAGSGIYGDSERNASTKGEDAFNILGVDTQSKTIKIVRIGLEYDKYMRRKNTLCWDYANGQLIYVD